MTQCDNVRNGDGFLEMDKSGKASSLNQAKMSTTKNGLSTFHGSYDKSVHAAFFCDQNSAENSAYVVCRQK